MRVRWYEQARIRKWKRENACIWEQPQLYTRCCCASVLISLLIFSLFFGFFFFCFAFTTLYQRILILSEWIHLAALCLHTFLDLSTSFLLLVRPSIRCYIAIIAAAVIAIAAIALGITHFISHGKFRSSFLRCSCSHFACHTNKNIIFFSTKYLFSSQRISFSLTLHWCARQI